MGREEVGASRWVASAEEVKIPILPQKNAARMGQPGLGYGVMSKTTPQLQVLPPSKVVP